MKCTSSDQCLAEDVGGWTTKQPLQGMHVYVYVYIYIYIYIYVYIYIYIYRNARGSERRTYNGQPTCFCGARRHVNSRSARVLAVTPPTERATSEDRMHPDIHNYIYIYIYICIYIHTHTHCTYNYTSIHASIHVMA